MPDPGDADFAFADFRETRRRVIAGTFDEKRWDEDGGEEVALMPVRAGPQLDPRGAFIFRTVLRRLANDVPPAFFRKRNRHAGPSI